MKSFLITSFASQFGLSLFVCGLFACGQTSFKGGQDKPETRGPSAGGDSAGTDETNKPDPKTKPSGGGDYAGVDEDEVVKIKVKETEDMQRRIKQLLSSSDGQDQGHGGNCPLLDRNAAPESKVRKVRIATGGETPIPVNVGEVARLCRPNDDKTCKFQFALYVKCSGFPCEEKRVVGHLTNIPEGETGYVAEVYEANITNYLDASCDVVGTSAPQRTKRSLDGCFDPEVKIMTERGERRIVDIQIGEMVLNPVQNRYYPVSEVTVGPEAKDMIRVGYAGGSAVLVTTEHPFMTKSGLKQAQNLTKADELITASGKHERISVLERLPARKDQIAVNIRLLTGDDSSASHLILAEGVVTGDLEMQQSLSAALKPSSNLARGDR